MSSSGIDSARGVLERAMEAILREEVKKLNVHLPKAKKSLKELLLEEAPAVETMGGNKLIMRREDVEGLAEEVPKEFHDRFMLPIVLVRRLELGRSVYSLAGGKLEARVVARILGLAEPGGEPLYVYTPHVSELKRRFRSLVVIGFSVPKELNF